MTLLSPTIVNGKEQTKEAIRCCVLLQHVPFTVPIPSSQPGFRPYFFYRFIFSFSNQNASQDFQLTMLIVLYICFSTKVSFDQVKVLLAQLLYKKTSPTFGDILSCIIVYFMSICIITVRCRDPFNKGSNKMHIYS